MFLSRNLIRPSLKLGSTIQIKRSVSSSKGVKELFKKIGDENSQESQKTMNFIRKTGAFSIIVVICSVMWASALETPQIEEKIENIDLSQDIRKLADTSSSKD